MNSKTWLLLFVALICGGAAAMCVKSIFFVETEENVDVVAIGPKSQMLVANVDLPSGSELTAQNVRMTLTPERDVPRDAISSFNDVVGSRTARDLKAGEPISLFDLAATEEETEAAATFIKPGCVVVPIEIQTATKAGGGRDFLKTTELEKMLKSGDVVDLAVVKEEKSEAASAFASSTSQRRRLTTETIVEGVDVVGVSDESRFSRETGEVERLSTVRVQLSQEQLETVRRAAETGRVKIVPRVDKAELGVGVSDAPLADGSVPFEPPMNAGFSLGELSGNEEKAASFGVAADESESNEAAETSDENASFVVAADESESNEAAETSDE
ncbi:MAG: Flp pilus assembly protein CpaB, partial [Thermoguttaceae bacterium]|nr:Flp pilus assembly protein CpaB [Thermoguttaceae bacterium]